MQNGKENIYISLQQLIWSTFLGVISFQLIVPNVWSYTEAILRVPPEISYQAFLFVYGLALPTAVIIWIYLNFEKLKASLFPLDNELEIDTLSKWFLRTLVGAILFQMVSFASIVTRIVTDRWIFTALQVFHAFSSTVLVGLGIYLAISRVRAFQDLPHNIHFKKTLYKGIATWSVISIGLLAIGIFHYRGNHEKFIERTKTIGFVLLSKQQKLDTLFRVVAKSLDSLAWVAADKDTAAYSNGLLKSKADSIRAWVNNQKKSIDTSKAAITSWKKLTTLLVAGKKWVQWKTRHELGRQLRNDQLPTTYLLMNLFLLITSLLVFLRMDLMIRDFECQDPRRQLELEPDNPGLKVALANKVEKRADALKLSQALWLYITISVWLLIPLFKPVQDDKIDLDAPFRMLTLSRPDSPIGDTFTTNDYRVINSFNNSIDSVLIQIDKSTKGDLTMKDLDSIKSNFRKLNDRLENIEGKVRFLTPNN
jgi:hypothetical protein